MSAKSTGHIDHVAKANACWNGEVPDWIIVLAEACNDASQSKVAARLNWSPTAISQTIGNTYGQAKGDLKAVEDSVRGVFMSGTVECPALGSLPTNECRAWRKKAKGFGNANMLRVRMHRACNRCPLNKTGGRDV